MENQLAFIGGIGTTELLVIGGIAFLLFGVKRLPEMGKGLAVGIREFRKGLQGSPEKKEGKTTEVQLKENGDQKDDKSGCNCC